MKILAVLPRFPYPLEKGDKLRAYHQLRCLAANNEVYLFCLSHKDVLPEHIDLLKAFCREVEVVRLHHFPSCLSALWNMLRVRSLQTGYWTSARSRRRYKAFEQKVKPDVIYSQMVRTMPLVARSTYPKVMDYQDALSLNTHRRMERSKGLLRRGAFHYEFKMLRSAEYDAFDIFDDLTIISEPDSMAIPHRMNHTIHLVPNGVDFDFFHPMPEVEKQYDVVFCGNMQYSPNVDTSVFLATEVMPLVWKECPQARLLLAGATPTAAVRKLANDRVTVSGTVDDIRRCYASGRIFAAPMRLGSGLQNKLLEAMAMQLPCITSTLANHALGATPDRHLLIGDDAPTVARHIVQLLHNPRQGEQLVNEASDFVHQHFSWEAYGQQLEQILLQASKKRENK